MSKCSGVLSFVLANTLHGVRSENQFLQLVLSRDYLSVPESVLEGDLFARTWLSNSDLQTDIYRR